ncbi:unnamed protein product [Trichobilharzia szidati]|nr:unnamed protein product [Trichobilharzia szidati]
MKPKPLKPPTISAPKVILFLKLQFRGDTSAEMLRNRLTEKTFLEAELRLTFSTTLIIHMNVKHKLPLLTSSACIYQFTCSCAARDVGSTQRLLSNIYLHGFIKEKKAPGTLDWI